MCAHTMCIKDSRHVGGSDISINDTLDLRDGESELEKRVDWEVQLVKHLEAADKSKGFFVGDDVVSPCRYRGVWRKTGRLRLRLPP